MHLLPYFIIIINEIIYMLGATININGRFNSSEWNNSYFCRTISKNTSSNNKFKNVFDEMVEYKLLKHLLYSVNEIPVNFIRLNKQLLSQFMKQDGIGDTDIYVYALLFYNDLEKLYRMLPSKISFEMVDQYLQRLMITILTTEATSRNLGLSPDSLRTCFQSNRLFAHSVNIFGDQSYEWFKSFSQGVKHYQRIHRMLQLTLNVLDSGPSGSCQAGMRKLSLGCPDTDGCFGTVAKQECSTPCSSYCTNIIRGCLTPTVLFAPKQFAYLDMKLLWNYKSQVHFNDLVASLNATKLYTLLREGIKNVEENVIPLKSRLQQFCRGSKLKSTSVSSSASYHDNVLPNEMKTVYETNFSIEYNKMIDFIKTTEKDLNSLINKVDNLKKYMNSIESFYCSEGNEYMCWNGSSFDRYTRKVSDFSMNSQMRNPEIIITSEDLQFHLLQEMHVRKRTEAKGSYSKMNVGSEIPPSNLVISQTNSKHENEFKAESSGMHPQFSLTELDMFQMNTYNDDGNPSPFFSDSNGRQENNDISSDDLVNRAVNQGCSVDDEDCQLHFADIHLEENDSNEVNGYSTSHDISLDSERNSPGIKISYQMIKKLRFLISENN
uniref:Glypican n=1 Tax=Trichobilharzia regenti TaxID=157069 RepID=A0AA85IYE4_TRIRE|nr:unnamed protein product [Trichobilharzia regenti]